VVWKIDEVAHRGSHHEQSFLLHELKVGAEFFLLHELKAGSSQRQLGEQDSRKAGSAAESTHATHPHGYQAQPAGQRPNTIHRNVMVFPSPSGVGVTQLVGPHATTRKRGKGGTGSQKARGCDLPQTQTHLPRRKRNTIANFVGSNACSKKPKHAPGRPQGSHFQPGTVLCCPACSCPAL